MKNVLQNVRNMSDWMNYHQRLKKLELYSLERRRERFMIINAWQQIEGLKENQVYIFLTLPPYGKKGQQLRPKWKIILKNWKIEKNMMEKRQNEKWDYIFPI